MQRHLMIKRASWIGIAGNAFLSVMKLVLGAVSGSMALVGDGIDSATDIVASLITLFAAGILAKPPDPGHPYGHGRAETVATKLLAFMIFFAGAQFMIGTMGRVLGGGSLKKPGILAVYAALASIAGKWFLARVQHRLAKKTQSPMLEATAKNMESDLLISGSVLAGLGLTYWLDFAAADLLVALGIGGWVMKSAWGLFMEASSETMEETRDLTIYKTLFELVARVEGAHHPHRTRVRRFGELLFIDMDIEVDPHLPVWKAHGIAHKVEEKIRGAVPSVYDIMVHIEPLGCDRDQEKYGLSKEIIRDNEPTEED